MKDCTARSCRSFIRETNGSIITSFAAVILAIGIAAGMALDYQRMVHTQNRIQNAVDSAALAAALADGTDSQRQKSGADVFLANTSNACKNAPDVTISTDKVEVKARCTIQATFLRLAGNSELHVEALARASFSKARKFRCLHALDPSKSEAVIYNNRRGPLTYSGDSIIAPECDVQVNSAHSDALLIKEDEGYEFARHCIVGGVDGDVAQIKPAPDSKCKTAISDPLSARSLPIAPSCGTGSISTAGDTVTLTQGSFCSGIDVNGDNIIFAPGVYHVTGGDVELKADASITADGITIVMHPGSGSIAMETSGHLDLKAIKTGKTAKFLIFDRNKTAKEHLLKTDKNDVSYMALDGIIYAPEDHIELFWKRAGVGAEEKPVYFENFGIIANTIDLHGYNQLFINPPELGSELPELAAGSEDNVVRLIY